MVGKFLNDPAAMTAMRDKIREELPSLFNLFRADAYLLKKIVASAGSMLDEVRADPDHALRREFDRFVGTFIDRLRHSSDYAARAETTEARLAEPPGTASMLTGDMWEGLRAFIEQDLRWRTNPPCASNWRRCSSISAGTWRATAPSAPT